MGSTNTYSLPQSDHAALAYCPQIKPDGWDSTWTTWSLTPGTSRRKAAGRLAAPRFVILCASLAVSAPNQRVTIASVGGGSDATTRRFIGAQKGR
jgi:hypothetical protein